jgi:hypothetical protein
MVAWKIIFITSLSPSIPWFLWQFVLSYSFLDALVKKDFVVPFIWPYSLKIVLAIRLLSSSVDIMAYSRFFCEDYTDIIAAMFV